nr:hypothetical protein [Tanacetum cinerariifolium]
MTDIYPQHEGGRGMQHFNQGHHLQGQQHYQSTSGGPLAHQIAKAATSATAGGMLLVLSGLTLAGTIISLIVATPLLVIFSPVLVPAVITMFLLATGFLTSGGFGVAAATVLMWMKVLCEMYYGRKLKPSVLSYIVPAVITMFLLATGFLTSGGFGVAAATVLMWMYRYATDRRPTGADTMDDTAKMLGSKIREKSEHATAGGHYGGIGAGGHVGYQT